MNKKNTIALAKNIASKLGYPYDNAPEYVQKGLQNAAFFHNIGLNVCRETVDRQIEYAVSAFLAGTRADELHKLVAKLLVDYHPRTAQERDLDMWQSEVQASREADYPR